MGRGGRGLREALAAARPNSGAAVVSLRALGNRVRVADLHARIHPVSQGKSPGAVRAGAAALHLFLLTARHWPFRERGLIVF